MKKGHTIELLAPGGDVEAIKAAIAAGANAIYCGLDRFNARNRAANITLDSLKTLLHIAHEHNCKIFLTLNIVILQSEFPSLFKLLNALVNTTIDGVIVQDVCLFYLLKKMFPRLSVHASTQCTTHNEDQLRFLKKLGADRVNLCRELSLKEIAPITQKAHELHMEVEVFVHGSNCIGISGLCYMSSHQSGNSGNRGRCSQPCRDAYEETAQGVSYPLNLKDKSAWDELALLADIQVDSLKIEGRIKKSHYVYSVVDSWRKHIDSLDQSEIEEVDKERLFTVFNRDLSNNYLTGSISSSHFIDNARDNAALHRALQSGDVTESSLSDAKEEIYRERTEIIQQVNSAIESIDAEMPFADISFSGDKGTPLTLQIKTGGDSWEILSESHLRTTNRRSDMLHEQLLKNRFKQLNDLGYTVRSFTAKSLQQNLSLPFRELTTMKKQALQVLNEGKPLLPPVELPAIAITENEKKSRVAVLLDDESMLHTIPERVEVYRVLPNVFPESNASLLKFFTDNPHCTPWFPAMLIGDSYERAKAFLLDLHPRQIITENSGIAFVASEQNIAWIAGPQFNAVNTYTLEALQNTYNCSGAFISNELNKRQVYAIQAPENFELHYSLLHPSLLMTSRQCFFHQTTGCKKSIIDAACLNSCSRTARIKDLKEREYILEKSAGNYHRLFASEHYCNSDILTDFPTKFDCFLLDLRSIETGTTFLGSPAEIVTAFQKAVENPSMKDDILQNLFDTTDNRQYKKGL